MAKAYQLERLDTVEAFLAQAGPFLEADEAANHLILGLCSELARSDPSVVSPILLRVTQGDATAAVALRTGPRKLVVTTANAQAIDLLAAYAAQHMGDLPGVHGPRDTAECFARRYAELSGQVTEHDMTQRIYECQEVSAPRGVEGELRAAEPEELALLVDWTLAFARECHLPEDDPQPLIERKLSRGEIRVWDHDGPVSTTSLGGQSARLARISLVYTPPALRGRGYASAAVAALTGQVLAEGRRCFLYTDLANPISNHVYSKIGFEPVIDNSDWKFTCPR